MRCSLCSSKSTIYFKFGLSTCTEFPFNSLLCEIIATSCDPVATKWKLALKGLCRERKFIMAINCLHKLFDHSRTKCFVP